MGYKETIFPGADNRMSRGYRKNVQRKGQLPTLRRKHRRKTHKGEEASGNRIRIFQLQAFFLSFVLLAICDANYRLVFVDVGAYGKSSDSTVFLESTFQKQLVEGKIKFPESRPLPGQNVDSPFVIVGDEPISLSEKNNESLQRSFSFLKEGNF